MTYDALLALRGWGEAEFRLARPEFLEAVKFAMFAERLAPSIVAAKQVMAAPMPNVPLADVMRVKLDAEQRLKELVPLVVPNDG